MVLNSKHNLPESFPNLNHSGKSYNRIECCLTRNTSYSNSHTLELTYLANLASLIDINCKASCQVNSTWKPRPISTKMCLVSGLQKAPHNKEQLDLSSSWNLITDIYWNTLSHMFHGKWFCQFCTNFFNYSNLKNAVKEQS